MNGDSKETIRMHEITSCGLSVISLGVFFVSHHWLKCKPLNICFVFHFRSFRSLAQLWGFGMWKELFRWMMQMCPSVLTLKSPCMAWYLKQHPVQLVLVVAERKSVFLKIQCWSSCKAFQCENKLKLLIWFLAIMTHSKEIRNQLELSALAATLTFWLLQCFKIEALPLCIKLISLILTYFCQINFITS